MELQLNNKYPVSSTASGLESEIWSSLARVGAVSALALLPLQNANCANVADLSTVRGIVRSQDEWVSSASTINRKYEKMEFQVAASDLLSSSAKLLGKNSYERFKRFSEYPDGWGGGKGKSVSPQSVAALQSFLSDGQAFSAEPSIFLRQDGNLQLAWEDAEGNAIELDFLPSRITFFHEKNEQESTFSLDTQGICSLKENIQALQLL